jgi:hypothetical protein
LRLHLFTRPDTRWAGGGVRTALPVPVASNCLRISVLAMPS